MNKLKFKHYALFSWFLCIWLGKIVLDVTAQPLLFFTYYKVLGAPTVWHDSIFWTLMTVGTIYGILVMVVLPLLFVGHFYTKLKLISPMLSNSIRYSGLLDDFAEAQYRPIFGKIGKVTMGGSCIKNPTHHVKLFGTLAINGFVGEER